MDRLSSTPFWTVVSMGHSIPYIDPTVPGQAFAGQARSLRLIGGRPRAGTALQRCSVPQWPPCGWWTPYSTWDTI